MAPLPLPGEDVCWAPSSPHPSCLPGSARELGRAVPSGRCGPWAFPPIQPCVPGTEGTAPGPAFPAELAREEPIHLLGAQGVCELTEGAGRGRRP